ncbi:MAG: outer membrane beta-barrel protein [Prevotellaceae bacterium]|nr:outer membrane beta-barrel protein [Prevotellaceae bacterium]
MKKILLTLCIMAFGLGASAHELGIGANVLYGTQIKNAGFGVKATAGLTSKWRLEFSYNNYLDKGDDDRKLWDANLNVHYVMSVPLVHRVKFYPLVGLTYTNWKIPKAATSESEVTSGEVQPVAETRGSFLHTLANNMKDIKHNYVGANVGVGAQIKLAGPLWFNIDLKYQIIKRYSQFQPSVGLMLRF